MDGQRAAGLAIAGAAGVGLGFGLGYLVFRKRAQMPAPGAEALPGQPAQGALPAAATPAAPAPSQPAPAPTGAPPAPAKPPAMAGTPTGGTDLLRILPGLLGGGNGGFTGGLDTQGLPAPPPGSSVSLPTAPPVDPRAPVGSLNNPIRNRTGGLA